MERSKAVDIWRAVAVLLVLGRHLEPCPRGIDPVLHAISTTWNRGGWVGVDLFFVLSGFLVSGLLFREHQKYGSVSVKRFLVRRGFKIYPAFWLLIAVTLVVLRFFRITPPTRAVFSELAFVQNYGLAIWNHTWSLAVEEHFYFLLALLVGVLSRRNVSSNPFRVVPPLFLLLAVLCLALRIATWRMRPFSPGANLMPSHLRLDSLFCGVFISYVRHYHPERFEAWAARHRLLLLLGGGALLLPAFVFPLETTPLVYTVGFTIFYLGSGLLLIGLLAFEIPGGPLTRTVTFLGSRSYSVYLWHMPVAAWGVPLVIRALGGRVTWPTYASLSLAGAAAIGIVMSALVEIPALRGRDRWFPSPSRPLSPAGPP